MKILHYPIPKLTIVLAVGILVSEFLTVSVSTILAGIGLLSLVLIGIHFYCKKRHKTLYWPSLLILLTMALLGVFSSKIHHPSFSKTHYSHLESFSDNQLHQLEFVIKKRLKPTTYYHRYYVELQKIDSTLVSGTLLMNLSKDSTAASVNVNSKILTTAVLQKVKSPLNPYQFNYKNYLNRLGIYHQVFLKNQKVFAIPQSPKTLTGYAQEIREVLKQVESNNNPDAIGDDGCSFGVLQIRLGVIEDVNKQHGTSFIHNDAFDVGKSERIFDLYITIWTDNLENKLGREATAEDIVRIWNGGPLGYQKNSTIKYYNKYINYSYICNMETKPDTRKCLVGGKLGLVTGRYTHTVDVFIFKTKTTMYGVHKNYVKMLPIDLPLETNQLTIQFG